MVYYSTMENELCTLSIRAKLRNDCRLITDFAREVVQNDMAGNDKLVHNSLKGDKRGKLLQLLDALIDHLGEVKDENDFPGDCQEARELRMYSLAALGTYISRAGDLFKLATITSESALVFLDGLIRPNPYILFKIQSGFERSLARMLIHAAIMFGLCQLRAKWLNEQLLDISRQRSCVQNKPKVGEWMRREQRAVKTYARAHGIPEDKAVDSVWGENRQEYELAARFPESLRGYLNVTHLKNRIKA